MRPELADGLSRSAADLFVETPALAEGRGWADPIGALKNVGWHAAMIAHAHAEECLFGTKLWSEGLPMRDSD